MTNLVKRLRQCAGLRGMAATRCTSMPTNISAHGSEQNRSSGRGRNRSPQPGHMISIAASSDKLINKNITTYRIEINNGCFKRGVRQEQKYGSFAARRGNSGADRAARVRGNDRDVARRHAGLVRPPDRTAGAVVRQAIDAGRQVELTKVAA
jgi:hypothetical protein